MGKNSSKLVILLGSAAFLIHFIQQSPIGGNLLVMAILSAALPALAGGIGLLLWNDAIKPERIFKISIGSIVVGLLSFALEYNGGIMLNKVYNTQPEYVYWISRSVFELGRVLIPALLTIVILTYAFNPIKLFKLKRIVIVIAAFSVITVIFSLMTDICVVRIVPSEIVGDFGRAVGGSFMWIFDELAPLIYPAFILSIYLIADERINA